MLNQLLGVEIPLYSEISEDEIQLRCDQEEAAYLGKMDYLKGQITLEDYFDILELCEVDMDGFLLNLEENLTEAGLIIL